MIRALATTPASQRAWAEMGAFAESFPRAFEELAAALSPPPAFGEVGLKFQQERPVLVDKRASVKVD